MQKKKAFFIGLISVCLSKCKVQPTLRCGLKLWSWYSTGNAVSKGRFVMDECNSPCQCAVVQWQQREERGSCSQCESPQALTPQRSWNQDKAGTRRTGAAAVISQRVSPEKGGGHGEGVRKRERDKEIERESNRQIQGERMGQERVSGETERGEGEAVY